MEAEVTLTTFGCIQRNNVIADGNGSNTSADLFDNGTAAAGIIAKLSVSEIWALVTGSMSFHSNAFSVCSGQAG